MTEHSEQSTNRVLRFCMMKTRRMRTAFVRRSPRLHVEMLENRSLPSATTWPAALIPTAEIEPNDTLDVAQALTFTDQVPPGAAAAMQMAGGQGAISPRA